jgi:hypothetical protein
VCIVTLIRKIFVLSGTKPVKMSAAAAEQQAAPTARAEVVPNPTSDAANAPDATGAAAAPEAPGAPATIAEAEAGAEAEAPAPSESKEQPTVETTPIAQLWTAAKATGHPEVWGVTLADPEGHVPTRIILQKYLNANDGDVDKAKDQLTKTLEWRAKTKPLELVKKTFSKAKFDGLGHVTKYLQDGSAEPEGKEVFTWNIYGGVKSIDETFGNLEE